MRCEWSPARRTWTAGVLLVLLLSLGEGGECSQRRSAGQQQVANLVATLKKSGKFQNSLRLMYRTDFTQLSYVTFLQQILGVDSATLFLPTDAAWKRLPASLRSRLNGGDVRTVVNLLKFHTVRPVFKSSRLVAFRPGTTFLTSFGDLLEKRVPPSGEKTRIILGPPSTNVGKNYANVIAKDSYSSSIVAVHGIDNWMIPPSWQKK